MVAYVDSGLDILSFLQFFDVPLQFGQKRWKRMEQMVAKSEQKKHAG